MKDPVPVPVLPDDFVSEDDAGLFAFIDTLRISVRAKVAAEQQRGLSLSEIVVQVREMVRSAEEEAHHPKPFPAHAFRGISRQAVAWCIEAYRPLLFTAAIDVSERLKEPVANSLPLAAPGAGLSSDGLPARSPTYRGLP